MSDQSLRDAQLRQEFRAEIMRGYQAALCNSDVPGWTLGDEVAKVADNLLAAHPAEPAPSDYSQEEIAAKIADRVPHADLDGFTLSERLRIGKAVAPLFAELLGPRPMPTIDEVAYALFEHDSETTGRATPWGELGAIMKATYLDRGEAVLALLNGAEL